MLKSDKLSQNHTTMPNNKSAFAQVSDAFPMFGANIKRLWGTKDFTTYIKALLQDARDGSKTGFPEGVLSALIRLSDLHDRKFPELQPCIDNNENFKVVNEAFPRIGSKISACWGTAEFNPYISSLLHDSRGGNRKGFPFETLMALHALSEQHNKEYAQLYPLIDVWTQSDT